MASPSRYHNNDLGPNYTDQGLSEEVFSTHADVEEAEITARTELGVMDTQPHENLTTPRPSQSDLGGSSNQNDNNPKYSEHPPISPVLGSQLQHEPQVINTQHYNRYTIPEPSSFDIDFLLPSTAQPPLRYDTPPPEDWHYEHLEAKDTTTDILQESRDPSSPEFKDNSESRSHGSPSTDNDRGMGCLRHASTPPSLGSYESDDSDCSFSIIDLIQASQGARDKWSRTPFVLGVSSKENSISIKEEPIDELPNLSPSPPLTQQSNFSVLQLLTSQRLLLAGYIQPQDDTPMQDTPANIYGDADGENAPEPNTGPRDGREVVDYELVDQAMGNRDEDVEWMDNATGNAEEYEQLVQRIADLQQRQAYGKITRHENDELIKAQREMNTWNKLTGTDPARDSLFVDDETIDEHRVPTNTLETLGGFGNNGQIPMGIKANDSESETDTQYKSSNRNKSQKCKTAKVKHKQKAKEKVRGGGKPGRGTKSTKAPMKQRTGKKGANSSKPDRLFEGDLMFSSVANHNASNKAVLNHLTRNNTIDDFHSNAARHHGHGPSIETRNKATQLKQMFAAIPAGGDRRTIVADRAKLKKASLSFGRAKVKAENGKWKVAGMNSPLYHHQLLGSHWMVEREISEEQPHGGLLADSMGLGKTVEAIACMVANPPQASDLERGIKATLVVVPANVLSQWHSEIEIHSSRGHLDHVMIYKNSTKSSVRSLSVMDVVLCSYQEIMKQFPYPDIHDRGEMRQSGYARWLRNKGLELGLLHQVHWYRVILDEAHFIKNHNSRTSMACQNLSSIYRWCLTGTPLMNRIEEFYPYLRFLRANVGLDQQTFQKNFCNTSKPECRSRVNVLLSFTMLRRTMQSTLLNRPLITLPDPVATIKIVQFSEEEQIIYRITENRFRAILNTYLASGDLLHNYSMLMVQLLRLRQCTSHPFMLERTIKETWTLDDVNELQRKLKDIDSRNVRPFYERTKLWVGNRVSTPLPGVGENCDGDSMGKEVGVVISENLPFGRGDMGNIFNIDRVLGTLKKRDFAKRVQCGLCGDFAHNPADIDCKHTFCRGCLEEHMHRQASEAIDDPVYTCPTCSLTFSDLLPDVDGIDSELDDDDEGPTTAAQARGQKRIPASSKGRDSLGYEPFTTHSSWLQSSDAEDGSFPLTSSAKVTALKALLLLAFQENPMEKVIVFIQFRLLARIIGRLCNQEKWGFLYYTGDQTLKHRNKVVIEFKTNPDIRILICGLKCGGLGLNLTMASRCFILDLWWNHAVEQQAFGRIFRIGQERRTSMTRIVVENSVDMRMLSMQAHKLKDVENTMADHRAGAGGSLSAKQLVNLFGFLRTDEDGEILRIESDYRDDDGGGAVA